LTLVIYRFLGKVINGHLLDSGRLLSCSCENKDSIVELGLSSVAIGGQVWNQIGRSQLEPGALIATEGSIGWKAILLLKFGVGADDTTAVIPPSCAAIEAIYERALQMLWGKSSFGLDLPSATAEIIRCALWEGGNWLCSNWYSNWYIRQSGGAVFQLPVCISSSCLDLRPGIIRASTGASARNASLRDTTVFYYCTQTLFHTRNGQVGFWYGRRIAYGKEESDENNGDGQC